MRIHDQTEKILFYFILNEMLISDDISWLTISWEYEERKKNEPIMFSLFSFNNLFSDEKLLAMSK